MNDKIFINYRRDDSAGYAGRIYDRLRQHFGADNVFMDVDTIEPGVDFAEEIQRSLSACTVFIALIGNRWSAILDTSGKRRLENPDDFVRLEIQAALQKGIRVIPVLVHGAAMPSSEELPEALKPLSRRNAIRLDHERFDTDAGRLINVIEKVFQETENTHNIKTGRIELDPGVRQQRGQEALESQETQKKYTSVIPWTIGGIIGWAFWWLEGTVAFATIFMGAAIGAMTGLLVGKYLQNKPKPKWRGQVLQTVMAALGMGFGLPFFATYFFGESTDLIPVSISAILGSGISGMLFLAAHHLIHKKFKKLIRRT